LPLTLISSSILLALTRKIENHSLQPACSITSIITPTLELCVPFSVLAETVFKSMTREKEGSDPHKMETIASLIELWRKLDIRFLPPTNRVAEICWHLVDECKDRLQPTDRTHLGYALAYNMNYLITTDKILLHYQVPDGFQLKIVSLKDARETIGLR
jgi:predicted nucleic acid-binding protein